MRQLAQIEAPCGDRIESKLSALGTVLLVLAMIAPLGLWLMTA